MHLETLLAHAGCTAESDTGDVVAPLHLSSTFERAPDGTYPHGYRYSRTGNPTRADLETTLAEMEGGAAGAAFASGMAAALTVLQALPADAHIILPDDMYYGVRQLATEVFADRRLSFSDADLADPDALDDALREDTALVWIETPSNPLLKITDIAAVAERAHAAGARVIVDGTWTTPLLQRPLDLGADLVLHSVTKYLSGHSDVLGGTLITAQEDDFWQQIRTVQQTGGAVLDPFSAWLALRGMRSLAPRLRQQCASARRVANFLYAHERVTAVHYPGLPDHPGHAVASEQMRDYGAMCSFEIEGGREAAMTVAARAETFRRATSLGGTESLIEHRASIEPENSPTPEALLRLSIGLEHIDDLIDDLDRALAE